MIISISGTPGTGKTESAKVLAKMLGAKLLTINDAIRKGKIPYAWDKKRRTRVIDTDVLKKRIKRFIDKKRIVVIEGHLSHFIRSDYVFVLRANPDVLEKRLKRKKWKKEKIMENVQAEILDEITIEAVQNNNNAFEIDTSKKTARQTADLMREIFKNPSLHKKYRPGKINWTKKFMKKLIGD